VRRAIPLLAAACWLLSAALVAEAVSYPGALRIDQVVLGALCVAGLAACAAWLASWRRARAALAVTAALYLALYAFRTWAMQIEPRMAFTGDSFPEATLATLRIVQASVAHSLSLGNLLLAAGELFSEWLMPLAQAAVLAGAIGASRRAA
jgi:hypothetical protein